MRKIDLLKDSRFGERVAEDEQETLSSYFVKTDTWKQLLNDELDVIYGSKGSGKSALYSYLLQNEGSFSDRNTLLVPAEELRGDPVFGQVLAKDVISEEEFKGLWLIYILTLIGKQVTQFRSEDEKVEKFIRKLENEELLEGSGLRRILSNARDYVKDFFGRVNEVSGGLELDPLTSMPKLSGNITFFEPRKEQRRAGYISVYELLDLAQEVLESLNMKVWIMFDRLDVAFSESPELESVALKTLFKTYNDLKSKSNIKLKIFIRDDIWERIVSEDGFREGSHITKQVTIKWNEQDLFQLLTSRILDNQVFRDNFNVTKDEVLRDSNKQQEIFYSIFPEQVETGNNPKTFNWMVSRVKDGLGISAPRELIHLLNESRLAQIRQLETGTQENSYDEIISRSALKEALKEVSRVRLNQTIYTEFSALKPYIEMLKEHKTEQDLDTLCKIFGVSKKKSAEIVQGLVAIGLFEERKEKGTGTTTYWTPFMYRDGLKMIQGRET
ncbi:P-loop ATPase, Sll1717 family [Cytobacillus sp. SAFR-174]|uniref:P-loop ATPase, Sll1717 family n=1 Tax=Cytobacillus sp. SAFR-174 TaxID=3436868 RepID=UPI003F81DBB5